MMKSVKLLLVPSVVAALSLGGCAEDNQPQNVRVCVNKDTFKRVEDVSCGQQVVGSSGFFPYYWWYMSGARYYPGVGTDVRTIGVPGSFYHAGTTHESFATVPSSVGVSRGGFGSTSRSFSGGSAGG